MPSNTSTIGQLPPRGTLLGTDLIEVQAADGTNYKITLDELTTFINP